MACPHCTVPFLVERVDSGFAAVRPDNWWRPNTRHWIARCACRVLFGREEGDLYRSMGYPYA